VLALVISTFAGFATAAQGAGFSYSGGSGGTNVPITSLKILTARPLTSNSLILTLSPPAKPTSSNPARVRIQLRIPKGTFSRGYTLVVAAPPAILPALYFVNGHDSFASSSPPSRANVRPVRPGVRAAALSVHSLVSVYIGVYYKKKELTKKFRHPVTLIFTSTAITTADTLFETKALRWTSATGYRLRAGSLTTTLSTNHAFDLVRVLRSLDTVTFNDNGGQGTIKPVTVSQGSSVSLPSRGVTRRGYRLLGWSLKGVAPVLKSPYRVSASVDLRAVWAKGSAASATVRFDLDGGQGHVSAIDEVPGRSVVLPGAAVVSRRGYHLVGWGLSATSPIATSIYRVTKSVTLVAVWAPGSPTTDTLIFLANGGEGVVASRRVLEGSVESLPRTGLTRVGYRFLGWSPDGHAPLVANPYFVTHSVVLLAAWAQATSAKYVVEFLVNGGQGLVQNASGSIGTLVTLPTGAGLTRPGFTFMGWSRSGRGAALRGTIVIRGNLVLKAVWRA